jgi:formylglycine-generating enzyme required for sulfatase activity
MPATHPSRTRRPHPPAREPGSPLRALRAAAAAACVGIGVASAGPQAEPAAQGVERGMAEPRELARRAAAALEQVVYVPIAPGEFLMGCSAGESECGEDEKPAHRVAITKGFEIARHEVTQAVWQAVMGTNPSTFKASDRPVEQVSWNDVQEFLAALNGRRDGYRYRLPTEAEWEYAARAGSTGSFHGSLDAIAWYGVNSGGQTHPVGQKQPNAWGLHDMQGNVWEWCQDWYRDDLYRTLGEPPVFDPRGPASGQQRVLRGGSWYKFLWFLRVSSRFSFRPSGRFPHVGFRCVRTKS